MGDFLIGAAKNHEDTDRTHGALAEGLTLLLTTGSSPSAWAAEIESSLAARDTKGAASPAPLGLEVGGARGPMGASRMALL